MVAKFSAHAARLNTAVIAHLSDTEAKLNWEPVTGMFDNGFALGHVGEFGMASSAPSYTLATSQVPGSVIGKQLVIGETTPTTDAITYTVVAHEPDGKGLSRLLLEKA